MLFTNDLAFCGSNRHEDTKFDVTTSAFIPNRNEQQIMNIRSYRIPGAIAVALVLPLLQAHPPVSVPAAEESVSKKTILKTSDDEANTRPKPLEPIATRGLAWLAKTQNSDGGWGQGGGWRVNIINKQSAGGRVEGANVPDPSDIGNTAIALQCFLRAGTKLDQGDYSAVASRAADFLLEEIAKGNNDTLFITAVRDTQLQSKIGLYVDTFLAAQILADLKDQLPDATAEKRRATLLDMVVAKIEKHQQNDGAFAGNSGWAATLSQGLCSRALNTAWAAGAKVDIKTLEKDHSQNAEGLDRATGKVATTAVGDAGVDIYRYASKLGGMSRFSINNSKRRNQLETKLSSSDSNEQDKEAAKKELAEIDRADADQSVLLKQVANQVKNDGFVAGFGNNGGEEFISFMNIGEALHAQGGNDWLEWQKKMNKSIAIAQNIDGSWAGQHCITGRTFCTSSALMVLMSDRAPVPAEKPVAAKADSQQR